jgi:hypothetical protein
MKYTRMLQALEWASRTCSRGEALWMQARMLRQAAVTGIGLGPATLVVSVCAMMALASPAQALQYGAPSWLICAC